MLPYSVKIQYQKGRGDTLIAQFIELQYAKDFINQQLLKDRSLKLTRTYNIYDKFGVLLEGLNEATDNAEQSSSGQSKSQTFRPNPLQTNLRPTGMPISFIDKEEKDKT